MTPIKVEQVDEECIAEMLRAAEMWPGHVQVQQMREIAASHRIAAEAKTREAEQLAEDAIAALLREDEDAADDLIARLTAIRSRMETDNGR